MDEYYAQAVLQVLDSTPAVPLYVVTKMKEEDRRDLIIDRLPVDMPQKVHAYEKAKGEGNKADAENSLVQFLNVLSPHHLYWWKNEVCQTCKLTTCKQPVV